MQIIVRSSGSQVVEVAEGTTVLAVKQQLGAQHRLPLEAFYLCCGGRPLLDDALPLTAAVPPMATLDMSLRMLGGKVHGSLARAGKVKGQTPKIEKKEKKKEKTGRAKRRQQYNKRFVNVVTIPGAKKRGPNYQAKEM